jgi:hypothetical protein
MTNGTTATLSVPTREDVRILFTPKGTPHAQAQLRLNAMCLAGSEYSYRTLPVFAHLMSTQPLPPTVHLRNKVKKATKSTNLITRGLT